jgi:hypothetical protein
MLARAVWTLNTAFKPVLPLCALLENADDATLSGALRGSFVCHQTSMTIFVRYAYVPVSETGSALVSHPSLSPQAHFNALLRYSAHS